MSVCPSVSKITQTVLDKISGNFLRLGPWMRNLQFDLYPHAGILLIMPLQMPIAPLHFISNLLCSITSPVCF